MESKRVQISTSFISLRMTAIGALLVPLIILDFNNKGELFTQLIIAIIFFAISISIFILTYNQNKIEYDGDYFYLMNKKNNLAETIPISNVVALSYCFLGFSNGLSSYSYRVIYRTNNYEIKQFWLFPSTSTDTYVLKNEIKNRVPHVILTHDCFRKKENF
ncbi:MAG: hypothetical protein IPK88_04060 [Saprospiraceae bacterium]|nr:hypothetical protein [Candidatus Defluviibacterium haderslevense]